MLWEQRSLNTKISRTKFLKHGMQDRFSEIKKEPGKSLTKDTKLLKNSMKYKKSAGHSVRLWKEPLDSMNNCSAIVRSGFHSRNTACKLRINITVIFFGLGVG